MTTAPKRLINLLRGWPNASLLPASAWRSAANVVLADPDIYTPGLLYGPDWGYEPLREQLASWLTDFYKPSGGPVTSDRLCVTGGASQNLAVCLEVFSDPVYTRNIWMISPTYFMVCRIFEDCGFKGRLKSVPEDDEGVDIEYLKKELEKSEEDARKNGNDQPTLKPPHPSNKRFKHIIYVVPSFSNPSSKTMSLARRQQLVLLAREYECLIISDDVYDHLQWYVSCSASGNSAEAATVAKHPSEAMLPRVVDIDRDFEGGVEREGADGFGNVLSNGTFSKLMGPGCRTGWAEGTPKAAYAVSQVGSSKSGGAPSQLTATFLTTLLADGSVNEHITKILQPSYARRHALLTSTVSRVLGPFGVTLPAPATPPNSTSSSPLAVSGGYFIWLTLPPSIRAATLAARCQSSENLIIGPGPLFAVQGDERAVDLAHGVRLCLSWENEEVLVEGVERMGLVLKRMLSEEQGDGKDGEAWLNWVMVDGGKALPGGAKKKEVGVQDMALDLGEYN